MSEAPELPDPHRADSALNLVDANPYSADAPISSTRAEASSARDGSAYIDIPISSTRASAGPGVSKTIPTTVAGAVTSPLPEIPVAMRSRPELAVKFALDVPYRMATQFGIDTGRVVFDGCNPSKLEDVKLVSKESSASDSSIVTGKLPITVEGKPHLKRVIIKIVNPHALITEQGTVYEGQVYKRLINWLISKQYTPNLVGFYGLWECPGKAGKIISQKLSRVEQFVFKPFEQRLALQLLYTEYVEGLTFEDWLTFPYYSQTYPELNQIVLQIVYTLRVFEDVRLVHNDLHFGNILIQTLPRPVVLQFFITPTEWFTVKTRFIPKILDFDRSYWEELGPNRYLDEHTCRKTGVCSHYNSRIDLFTLVKILAYVAKHHPEILEQYRTQLSSYSKATINPLIASGWINESKHFGRMCKPVINTLDRSTKCRVNFDPPPDAMLDPEGFIRKFAHLHTGDINPPADYVFWPPSHDVRAMVELPYLGG